MFLQRLETPFEMLELSSNSKNKAAPTVSTRVPEFQRGVLDGLKMQSSVPDKNWSWRHYKTPYTTSLSPFSMKLKLMDRDVTLKITETDDPLTHAVALQTVKSEKEGKFGIGDRRYLR